MKTILISGSDTGIGKTHVVGSLAAFLGAPDTPIQVVKPVESGADPAGLPDADNAARTGGPDTTAHTLMRLELPIAPLAAAKAENRSLSVTALAKAVAALPDASWRLIEGAGGLAVPLDENGDDWTDFAEAVKADLTILVVPHRLGAINQARLVFSYAVRKGLNAVLWLNEVVPVNDRIRQSNLEGLRHLRLPLLAEQRYDSRHPLPPFSTDRLQAFLRNKAFHELAH